MNSTGKTAAQGAWGTVEWAWDHRGRLPAKEFVASLSPDDQAKLLALFKLLAEQGKIRNTEKFKRVEGTGLFEFKSFQLRLLGDFRPNRRFLVAHGLHKKKDKLSRGDIDTAIRILSENDIQERTSEREGTQA